METTTTTYTSHITIEGDKHGVYSVAFSPDGTTLAFDLCNTIRFCDISIAHENNVNSMDIEEYANEAVRSVAFSPDGKTIAGGIYNPETIYIWDVATRERVNIRVCKVFGMNITVTIVVRGLRAPPSFLTSMAGHGDPALQWMVRS